MVRKALFIVLLPVIVFVGTGWPMMHFTERDQFRRTEAPESVPLNFRANGYDAAAATAYWTWLDTSGRAAELRFLKIDLAFPVGFGGAVLASLLIARAALRRRIHLLWLAAPVATAIAADWVENLIHLQQLRAFASGGVVDADAIGRASAATVVKTWSFLLAEALVVAFAAWVALRGRRSEG